MCTPILTLKKQKTFHLWKNPHTEGTCHHIKGYACQWHGVNQLISIKPKLELFSCKCFQLPIYTKKLWIFNQSMILFIYKSAPWMLHNIGLLHKNIPYGTPQLQLYSSEWQTLNHTSLVLGNAIDWVYTAWFYSDFTQQIWNLPEEILFQSLCDHLKWCFWNWACTGGGRL